MILLFDEDNNNTLQRQNNNLVYLKNILLSEALTGLEFKFDHPNGNKILIKSDDIIRPNDIKVVRGLGFPSKNSISMGDLIIKFNVKFPLEISSERKELIYKLLPKRDRLRNINNMEKYYLEEYDSNNRNMAYDSDDEQPSVDGVQCAQQWYSLNVCTNHLKSI